MFNKLMAALSSTLLVGVVVLLLVRYFKSIMAYIQFWRTMEKIGGLKPHWVSGNMFRERGDKDFTKQVESMEQFPKFKRRWLGRLSGGIAFHDPVLAHNVLNNYKSKSRIYTAIRNVFGDALLTYEGKKWRHYRKLLNPAFHTNMMKSYMNIFNKTNMRLVERLKQKEEFCVKEECSRTGVEVITEAIHIENSFTSEQTNEYLTATNTLLNVFVECLKKPLLFNKWIFSKSKYKKMTDECLAVLNQHALRSIKLCRENKTENLKPNGMLEILANAKDEYGEPISDEEIIRQLNIFMFAGHETTAGALGWTLYCLSLNQEHQEKCREEISDVLKDKNEVSWEDLSKLTYTTMCIKETMRLYSPAFILSRKLNHETEVNDLVGEGYEGLTMPEETILWVDLFNLHRNPKVWEDPEKFDPLRFTQENTAKRAPNSYIPFATGKRNCIGQNFAMTELKVSLCLLLKSLKFSLHEDFPKPKIELYVTLRQDDKFMLRVKEI